MAAGEEDLLTIPSFTDIIRNSERGLSPLFFLPGGVYLYRVEIDALNALLEVQKRTNELLTEIKELMTEKQPQEAEKPKRRRNKGGSDK